MTKKIIYIIILFLLVSFIIFKISNENSGRPITSEKAKTVNTFKTDQTIEYNIIKTGSILNWRASHLGGVDPRNGNVHYKEAVVLVNNGKITNINLSIDMDKITVEDLPEEAIINLTEHLKSVDFFNVANYPTSKFELTSIKDIQGEYNSEITGNLTILGVSKSITFKANINVSEDEVSILSEDFIIDRSDWGMKYNAEGTVGVPMDYLISNDVGFTVNISILNQELIHSTSQLIDSLYTIDQNIQLKHSEAIKSGNKLKAKELYLEQIAVFKRHIPILKSIYNKIGYPTNAMVSKEHSNKFFTLIQHSDSDIGFQENMLNEISEEVKSGSINIQNYAFLTDRVKLAQHKSQVYGTQLNYNTINGQAFPKTLKDSINVNNRRLEIGLEPLEDYLNKATKAHFQMNGARYIKMGINEPKLYPKN